MKSLFSSILTLFLTIHALIAQTDKTGLAVPLVPMQEVKESDDATSGMRDPATISVPKSEPQAKVDNAAVIRYATSAKCLVSLVDNGALVQRILCKNVQTGSLSEQLVQNQKALFEALSLDQTYQLLVVGIDGKESVLQTIHTRKRVKEPINTAELLYNKLARWTVHPEDIPLSEFLGNLQEVPYYERLAVFQQYLLDDESLDDNLQEGHFPKNNSKAKLGGPACKCAFFMKVSGDVHNGFEQDGNSNIRFDSGGEPFTSYESGSWSGGWYQYGMLGPATYREVWSQGRRIHHYGTLFTVENLNAGAPYNAKLRYNYTCTNYREVPKDCACDKEVDLEFAYDTKLTAIVETPGCFLCGNNKGAAAVAEDQSLITMQKARTEEVKVLGAGRFHINTSRSTTLNTGFFVNLVDVAAKVAPIIVSSNNSSGGTQQRFSTQQINALATSIQTLIKTPVSSIQATDNKVNQAATLVSGRKFIIVEPNNPLDITLFSFPSVGASGFTSWKSNARVLSRFRMSAVLNGAAPREGLEACCSRPTAMWISGSMPDWASVRSNIQSHLRSAWPERGGPVVESDYGRFYGSLPMNCTEDSDLGGIRPGETVLSDNTWVEQKGDGAYFKETTRLLNCKYVVYDLNGRILKEGIGTGTHEKILDYNNDSGESRFYIVHVYVDGVNKIFKIFKP